jgi:hypothetical protein
MKDGKVNFVANAWNRKYLLCRNEDDETVIKSALNYLQVSFKSVYQLGKQDGF